MRIKVMKFGGTSVATHEARVLAANRVISAKEQGFAPVAVISAIGRKGQPYATDTLIQMLREIDPNVSPEPRELDLMMACGEILSSVIFAHTLKTLGHFAMTFRGGQAGIRTDGAYGNARIVSILPQSILRAIENGAIPVICGFQGVYVAGDGAPGAELTTLGRGGTDTTAAAIGAALQADAVEIFTDVDGVKTADPGMVKQAPTLRKVTYDEVAEIAHLGAKVVHPRAAEVAMQYGIPLWVKNTFSDDEGTEIVTKEKFPGRRMTGITHTGKLVYLQFDLTEASGEDQRFLEAKIYELLAQAGANLYMLNISPLGVGFAIPRDQFPMLRELFDGLLAPSEGGIYLFRIGKNPSPKASVQRSLVSGMANVREVVAEPSEGATMISLVGHETMSQAGLFHRVLRVLEEAQIPVFQTSDSDYSLSCLIPEADANRAVRLLHDAFQLSEIS